MTGKNNVGYDYSANGKITFQTFDPVKNKFNSTVFVEATSDEVNAAVELSEKAFQELQEIPHSLRADFLDAIANEIENIGDPLLHCYISESGLSLERAIAERARTLFQLRSFADHVRKNDWIEASIDSGDEKRNPPKPDLRKMLIGLGPVVVFGASNFPFAYSTAGGDTASAFAAGCPVIVKSHPMHAGTGELVSSAILKAAKKTNMPNGIFSNLNAQGFEVGKQLVMHRKIKAVGFTGSIAGGRALFDLANSRQEPIPVFAEMGSVNPILVLPELLNEKAVQWSEMYAASITNGSGQFCTKPGLIFVIKTPETEKFVSELGNQLLKKEASSMLHPFIFEKFNSNKQKAIQASNSTLVENDKELKENFGRQSLLIVDAESFRTNSVLHEEVFGPFAVIVKCTDIEDLINCVKVLKGQLTGTLLGSVKELRENTKLITILQQRVGRIIFNGVPTGVEVCPSMHHGGPYPASTDSRFTAVGIDAIRRFTRPIVFQNCPDEILPSPLKNINSLKIRRRINGNWSLDNVN